VTFDGRDLLALEPEERAHEGVFLRVPVPVEIPGVNNVICEGRMNAVANTVVCQRSMHSNSWPGARKDEAHAHGRELLSRGVNEGFSVVRRSARDPADADSQPRLAVLDETDSGLISMR